MNLSSTRNYNPVFRAMVMNLFSRYLARQDDDMFNLIAWPFSNCIVTSPRTENLAMLQIFLALVFLKLFDNVFDFLNMIFMRDEHCIFSLNDN
ncbi:hypothetical protein D3C81_1613260 [compost metagenome]